MEEVSKGLYSPASLTYGEADGQKESSDLDEPPGQEDPRYFVPYIILTKLIEAAACRPDATPPAKGMKNSY